MTDSNKYTDAGTDIEEVKRKNQNSGMSYNEAKEWIAKHTGGHGTNVFSDTDIENVKRK
ncbi:gamma-type small acid-soluble spore protein [Ornithinibacillus salinisoli]|uniref:Gamma-type small acid-soluble spore protein n=1 Tax=Ornithinibacillus salinisoli TaxID=1848459 RepID=A0ABW4W3W4_9BACI